MHWRGKDYIQIIYPDGRKETLLSVPRYDFNWQTSIASRSVPGRGFSIRSLRDNSANNLQSRSWKQTVRFGLQTWEEMMKVSSP